MRKVAGSKSCSTGIYKLKFLLISVFIICCLHLKSQIVYTDINDTILTFPEQTTGVLDDLTNYFYFDLDQDGSDDFHFYAHYWEAWYSPSASEHPHWVFQLVSMNGSGVPWLEGCAIDYGIFDTIYSEEWFDQGSLYVNVVGTTLYCNLPFQDRYIGLRLEMGSDYYYGWIRLDASTDTLVFKDFAYNSQANAIILAGQTGQAGISDSQFTSDYQLTLEGRNLTLKDIGNRFRSCSIINVQGLEIERHRIRDPLSIDLSQLSPGIYIVVLEGNYNRSVRKILIM